MPLKPEKRAFLVRVLGEERTKALTDALPKMERALMEAGIGWKELDSLKAAICTGPDCATGFADTVTEVVATVAIPVGPTTFEEAEKEDAAREKGAEVRSLTAVFEMLVGNIMALQQAEAAEKIKLLAKAVEELKSRLGKVGSKALVPSAGGFGGAKYVQDLLGSGSGTNSADAVAAEAEAKRLRNSDQPTAGIVADLLTGGAVQG